MQDSILPIEALPKIVRINEIINGIVAFGKKYAKRFPNITNRSENLYICKEIPKAIHKVMDDRGEIKDNASSQLSEIRKKLKSIQRQIEKAFADQIKILSSQGWLSEYKESVVQNKRVLVLQAEFKRKVKGRNLGSSKTGKFVYLEPSQVTDLESDLNDLRIDEQNEIYRILRELTAQIREHYELLLNSNKHLIYMDMLQAKLKLALSMNACLPGISDDKEIELYQAYHPLLLLENKERGENTFPQDITMSKDKRILVISGPNAGGKSVTLKTLGLLQIMIQCGLLIPVNANSTIGIFQRILTDIGDNQSIENHLSTYSYRLKNMKRFLDLIDSETLILLDEFGTGSDPELGGALAEVFFEEIFQRKCFCVITTHYANIKVKAFEYEEAENACMLFDEKSLKPLYKLLIGQPGSSFTFEVAKINGIGSKLIKRARKKLDNKTVRLDDVMVELQRNKSEVEDLKKSLVQAEGSAENVEAKFKTKLERLRDKAERQQALVEKNNDFINFGRKMKIFISDYSPFKKNDKLFKRIEKYIATEKSKLDMEKRVKAHKVAKATESSKNYKMQRNQHKISEGCTVRLFNNKKWGTVISMDKKGVVVQFGDFITKVELDKLVWVRD
ncbi:MAG: DNA mismatch repair protein MutS [Bacteroidota bacterium]